MTLNPPLRHDGIEVTSINPDGRSLSLVIYVKAHSPMQVHTPEVQQDIRVKVNHIVHYLELEGYIPKDANWVVNAGLVLITP